MEMCFHGNQLSWAIKHRIISLYLKYHSLGYIFFPTMLAPVILSLDKIYCMYVDGGWMPLPTLPQQNCDPALLVYHVLVEKGRC